ncbi:MAG: metallophosphoesterase, partial [Lachnospiraceae bacterium]|nr:metallophosphoesterase [Lachnospiraceae bacterium]
MKLAVISDIHGNYKAFEAFLEFARQLEPDGIIGLGDYVTDSPYPQRTLGLLYDMMEKYPCYLVKGNREEYLIRNFHEPQGWKPSSSNGLLYYTAQHITEGDIAFFESLKICDTVEIEGYPTLTICHGIPDRSRGNFTEEPGLKDRCMRALETKYLLGGHSHHQETDRLYGKLYV